MKKNLASFGTALSRDEAKKVVGGGDDADLDNPGGGSGCSLRECSTDSDCSWDCHCAQGGTSKFCSSPA